MWVNVMPVLVEVLTAASCTRPAKSSRGECTSAHPEECCVEDSVTMHQYVRKVLEAALTFEVSSRGNSLVEHEHWRNELHESICGFLRDWSETCADSGDVVQPLSAVCAYLKDVNDRKVSPCCHLIVTSTGGCCFPLVMPHFVPVPTGCGCNGNTLAAPIFVCVCVYIYIYIYIYILKSVPHVVGSYK